jgi:Ser-tRNA(Ala) deacylase AlaX
VHTNQLYYADPYRTESTGTILAVAATGRPRVVEVELDQTIFYPQGGGQPSDQGAIKTESGALKVSLVRYRGDRILHEGPIVGNLAEGEPFLAELKWSRRLKYMRVHSAGHLLHDVLMTLVSDLVPLRGNHGDKAVLEYQGFVDPALQSVLEERIAANVASDLPIRTREVEYDELVDLGARIPANLPKNKPLRIIEIGSYPPMPDGGVHVRTTGEIDSVLIHSIANSDGRAAIRYGVSGRTDR